MTSRFSLSNKFALFLLAIIASLLFRSLAYAASLTISGSLTENTLNGANVNITLTDDTFLDSTLQSGNFVLNNAPSGLSIGNVSYVNSTTANLTLAFNNTDFDSNITNFSVTVNGSELTSNAGMTSNTLTITAVVEASPAVTISGSLNESNLNGASISISLANDTFKDSTLDKANFTLNNAPTGTIVASVSYGSTTSATLSFSFNGTDFDSNITNFSITVNGSELTANGSVTSNTLTITAVQETSPTLTISGSLNEGNLDGATVGLSLTNDTFKDSSLDKANFTLNNAPSGTSVSSVSFTNSTTASLTLDFNGTDFDSNVNNFTIVIAGTELTSNSSVISNALVISAVQEGADTVKPTISSVTVTGGDTVTITMSENINRVGSLSDLKSKLRFADDGSTYDSLESSDSVADINGTDKKIIITFDTALSGTANRIKILSGAVRDAAGNQNNELISSSFSSSGNDTTKPTIASVTVDHTLQVVTVIFSEDIERAASSLSSLKSKITFAADGSDYEPLSSGTTVSDPDGDDEKLIITFDDDISGTKNKIRIEADAVEDTSGNKNNELTTSSFQAKDTEKPYIKSATIDSAKKVVTLTFQEDIDKVDTLSTLKNKIELAENGTDFDDLSDDDEISDLDGSDNVLRITFDEALSGSKNKIRILSGAVEDEIGNRNAELVTDALSTGGGLPVIASVTVDETNRKITLVFNENIDLTGSLSALKNDIQFAADGVNFDDLEEDDEVDDPDGGKNLVLTFDAPIAGVKNKLRIAAGAVEDDDGNENVELTSPAFAAKGADAVKPAVDDVMVASGNKKVTIVFTENISKTGDGEDLKASLKLSTDGTNFSSLSSADTVSGADGEGKNLVLTFSEPLSGTKNKIKILSGAVEDEAGNENAEIVTAALDLTSDHPFSDAKEHWAEEYIAKIYALGVVEGRSPGLYAPNENLTRGELAKIALKAFNFTVPSTVEEKPFIDVEINAWYAVFVSVAKKMGIIGGYEDGTFLPNRDISRVEALKMLMVASGLEVGNETVFFTDTPENAWYQKYLAFAKKKGIIEGYADGSFGPGKSVTRAEIAKMAWLILELKEGL